VKLKGNQKSEFWAEEVLGSATTLMDKSYGIWAKINFVT